jgi:hypothetical protein
MRVIILEFLDTDIFNISSADCISFLSPLLARWDIELSTFDMEIVLNERLVPGEPKRFAFVETEFDSTREDEPGFTKFLQDDTLSGDASAKEVEFLRNLQFGGKQPTAMYYYRALQNLRDPLQQIAKCAKIGKLAVSSLRGRESLRIQVLSLLCSARPE